MFLFSVLKIFVTFVSGQDSSNGRSSLKEYSFLVLHDRATDSNSNAAFLKILVCKFVLWLSILEGRRTF